MNDKSDRYNELQDMFAEATLDNAQDCLEWLIHVQDFCQMDESLDSVLARLESHTGQALHMPTVVKLDTELKPFDRIFAMFETAKSKGLSWPKLVLGGELEITLTINAKGIINVTNGKRYGTPSNVWYGRISPPNGTVCANLDIRDNMPKGDKDVIQARLQEFDRNPDIIAKMYGHETGNCMCCGKQLTNPDSIAAGIGPICASNFGLGG